MLETNAMAFPIQKHSLERAVETVVVALIKRQRGPFSTLPVLRSDESAQTENISSVVVTATREDAPLVVNESDPRFSTLRMAVDVVYHSLAPIESTDKGVESDAWNDVEEAMRSTDATGIDLDRFADFVIFPGSSSETETDGDGRKTRTRKFRIGIEEAAPAGDPEPIILPPYPPIDEEFPT